MNENGIPSGHGVRERILVEVDTLRQRYQAAKESGGTLAWFGNEYWIDRERGLVMLTGVAKQLGIETLTTVPDSLYDEIEYYGCRKATTGVGQMLRFLGQFVGSSGNPPPGASTDFLNFAVVQPLVNPAFDSLFWLGLAWLIRPNTNSRNLGEGIGELAIDLSRYPASQSEMPDVRKAQAEFVKARFEPDLDVAAWTRASEKDWTAHCNDLMHAKRDEVDGVFFEIRHKALRGD